MDEGFAYRKVKLQKLSRKFNRIFQTKYCETEYCNKIAINIGQSMDEFTPPCIDFYQFTCGNWIQNAKLSGNISQNQPILQMVKNNYKELKGFFLHLIKVFQCFFLLNNFYLLESILLTDAKNEPKFFQSLRNFYQSCIDLDEIVAAGTRPLMAILKRIGGWPILDLEPFDETNFHWLTALINIHKENLFFQSVMQFQIVPFDFGEYLLFINRPAPHFFHLPNQILIAAIIKELTGNSKNVSNEINEIVKFEMELLTLYKFNVTDIKLAKFKELSQYFPSIDWKLLFQTIFSNNFEQITILLSNDVYLEEISKLLNKTNKRLV